ncbi:MAG: hypothetical protein RMK32_03030 [Anaerolineae bacterium]|nr:hypothetical protein [Anaerolineae bacterium]
MARPSASPPTSVYGGLRRDALLEAARSAPEIPELKHRSWRNDRWNIERWGERA